MCQLRRAPVVALGLVAFSLAAAPAATQVPPTGVIQVAANAVAPVANPVGGVVATTLNITSTAPGLVTQLTTVGSTVLSAPATVAAGTYVVTATPAAGGTVTAISCNGQSSVDLASRSATVTVAAGQTVVCTFTGQSAQAVQAQTLETTGDFMENRAVLMGALNLGMDRGMDRLGGRSQARAPAFAIAPLEGHGGLGFAGEKAVLSTSLARMAGGDVDRPTDLWVEGEFARYTDREGVAKRSGEFGALGTGVDHVVTPDLLLGGYVQVDRFRERGTPGNRTEGEGWLAGPYVDARLSDGLYFQARMGWGRSENTVEAAGRGESRFDSRRWTAQAALLGAWESGAWRVSPNVKAYYYGETQEAFRDVLGNTIAEQELALGQASVGLEARYSLRVGDTGVLEPFGTVAARAVLDERREVTGLGRFPGDEGSGRMTVGGGFHYRTGRYQVSGSSFYDGPGEKLKAYGANVRVIIPLN